MPENKAPLLKPSFAFSGSSISSLLKLLSLADLHHVHLITRWPWATMPPLPSSPPSWHFRFLSALVVQEFPVCALMK